MLKIHLIVASLPPQLDGIGDYTVNLAAELVKSCTLKILTAQNQAPTPIANVVIEQAFDVEQPYSMRRICRRVTKDTPDWVLLQYNPFSYGRWGFNPYLPLSMRTMKRRHPRIRFALMAHENFVPLINLKFAVMGTWQRWQFWMLGRTADVVFFSIGKWAQQGRTWFPGKPVVHLPVGSSIPLVAISRDESRSRLKIEEQTKVIGLFGTAHPSRMLPWIRNAAQAARQAGHDILVLYVGPHGEAVRQVLGDVPLRDEGQLPGDQVSSRLAAMDVYLSPFVDGVSTRRSSLMTGLQHGVTTVGTLGINTDRVFREEDGRALLLADVKSSEQFDAYVLQALDDIKLRERLGQRARVLYQREFKWERIAQRMLETMREIGATE